MDNFLYIKRVDRYRDSGEFKCVAIDAMTKYLVGKSSPGKLVINWLEDNVTVIGEDNLKQSSFVALKCLAYGSKRLNIKWYINGNR